MKKSIFLFFAAILCAIGMNAAQVTPNGKYFYFKTSSTWNVDGPRYAVYFAWRNGGGEDKTWASCKTVPGTTDILYVTAPGEFWDIYFCRMNGSTTDNKDANVWNKTDKLQYDGSKNFWTKNAAWDGKTTYSTYVPAISSVTLSDNGTSIISGTGTQADPYLVYAETTIKVKGAGTKVLDDPDAKLNYNFKQGTTSKQEGTSATYQFTASATADTEYTINLDGYTKVNTTKSTVTKSATALYYKTVERAEETNTVTISYKCGDKDVQTGITEVVGVSTTSSFTAPTNITGYKFTNWTIGAGIDLKAGTASDATITVVTKSAASDYTLVANYEEVLETVYFINTGKWSVVNLHRWGGTATETPWPGKPMTSTGEKIGEYDVYSFTAQQGAFANVIFTNKNTGSDQTDDLTWTAGKYYIYNYGGKSGWYTKAEAEELLVVPVVTHDIVVKAVVPEAWTSTTISIHYWGDGISATSNPVATEKDGNWNKYTIKNVPEGVSVNVIFLNGTSWPDDKSKQTANITGITEDKCFQISAKTLDGEGKCTFTEVDCAADIKPEGDVYTVVGSSDELGLAWDPTKKANDMEKQDDGSYKKVYSNVELTTSVEWKIAKNGDWWNETPLENKAANGNSVLTISKSGIYNVTFTLSKDLKTAHAAAELLEETNTVADCFVSGNAALTGGAGWAGNEFKMEYDDANETYSYTLTGLATDKAYELKIVLGGAWYGFDELVVPAPANVSKGTDNSIAFKMEEAGDVTVTYHVTNGINLTGNFAAPAPEAKKYYVKGTHNEWTADATSEMTLDGEVYKKEVTLAKDVEFKINDGADGWWGKDNLGGKSYNELEGLESGNLKMKEAKTFTIIFKPAEHLITFEDLTEKAPAPTTYTVAGDSEAAFGTTWDPTNTANDMALEDGLYKWTKTNVALYANTKISFKVVKNHDWNNGQWPERDGENDNNWILQKGITADGLYTITITFNESTKEIQATATKTGDIVIKDFSNQPATLYFHPSFHWTSDAAQFAAYFYNNGPGADATPTWVNMTDGDGDGIYEVANAKQHEYVIICRMNPSRTENKWDDGVKWNQIESGITIPNTAGDLNTCLAFWKNCQGDVPVSECTWVVPTPLTDANWSTFVSTYAGQTINAVVERSFTSGQNHTLCLPFNLPTSWLGNGSKAYQLNSIFANTAEELQLNASECNTIEAGKPYIIVPVKGDEYEHIIVSGVTVEDVAAGTNIATGDGYKATLKAVTTTGGQTNGSTEYYVGANDGYLYNAVVNKLGLRAIIELTTVGGQPLPAKVRARVVNSENAATGLDNITNGENTTIKVIENGQLIIIRNGEKFNAQGVRF